MAQEKNRLEGLEEQLKAAHNIIELLEEELKVVKKRAREEKIRLLNLLEEEQDRAILAERQLQALEENTVYKSVCVRKH